MNIGLIVHTLITNKEGHILVLQRAADSTVYPNVWDIPGGTLEAGEDPRAGAIRETREETGLEMNDPELFSYTSNVDEEKDTQFIRLIFTARYEGGEVKINPAEHQAFAWILPSQAEGEQYVYYLPELFKKGKLMI